MTRKKVNWKESDRMRMRERERERERERGRERERKRQRAKVIKEKEKGRIKRRKGDMHFVTRPRIRKKRNKICSFLKMTCNITKEFQLLFFTWNHRGAMELQE